MLCTRKRTHEPSTSVTHTVISSGEPQHYFCITSFKDDVLGIISIAHRRTWIFCAVWRRECAVCLVGDGLLGNEKGDNRGITGAQRAVAMIRLRVVRQMLL